MQIKSRILNVRANIGTHLRLKARSTVTYFSEYSLWSCSKWLPFCELSLTIQFLIKAVFSGISTGLGQIQKISFMCEKRILLRRNPLLRVRGDENFRERRRKCCINNFFGNEN